jgi:hypothetical protein
LQTGYMPQVRDVLSAFVQHGWHVPPPLHPLPAGQVPQLTPGQNGEAPHWSSASQQG